MLKYELKAGMIVQLRNDTKLMVMPYGIIGEDGVVELELNNYNNDLLDVDVDIEFDIIKVYDIATDGFDFECNYRKLLWERNERPKLTNPERAILENLNKEYKYIARDRDNRLYLYSEKPKKYSIDVWASEESTFSLKIFNHCFKFVKWEDNEPYSIKELLKK